MASEPAIVLTDDSDCEIQEPESHPRPTVPAARRRALSDRSRLPHLLRQNIRRRSGSLTPGSLRIPGAALRRSPRTQESLIDLTSLSDEDIVLINSSGPRKPASKRKASPAQIPLPESPVGKPAAKCGICFQAMDEKMSCGPCGHVFCDGCLRQAIKTQKKCPTCRRSVQAKQIHRVFLNQ